MCAYLCCLLCLYTCVIVWWLCIWSVRVGGVCVWYMGAHICCHVCTHVCGICVYGMFTCSVCVCACEGCLTILAGVSDRICQWSSLSLHLQSLWERVSSDRRQILWAEEPTPFPLGGRMMFSQWLHNSSNQSSSRLSAICIARISRLSFVFNFFFFIGLLFVLALESFHCYIVEVLNLLFCDHWLSWHAQTFHTLL